jgi:hypothetical protein
MTDDHTHRGDDVHSVEAAERGDNGGWQPIETAPKDGQRVMLHSPETHTYTGICASWCIIDLIWEEWDSHFPCYPTHWQPVPAAPTEDT